MSRSPSVPAETGTAATRGRGGNGTVPGSHAARRWQVQLLGGFRLRDAAHQEVTVAGRSAMLLLARLAAGVDRTHPREELVELLWPGVSPEAGRNRLRQTVWVLRSVLEAPGLDAMPALIADRHALRLSQGMVDCDVAHFESLVRERRFDEAARAYGGELLPGFYDEWVHDERLRLAALFERCQQAPSVPGAGAAVAGASSRPHPRAAPGPARGAPTVASLRGWQPTALPAYVSRAFGIERQASRLGEELQTHRLVTLIGAGGTGKTRLAVELARRLADAVDEGSRQGVQRLRFDAVQFIPLLACTTVRDMADALALGLHLRSGPTDDALGPVVRALGDRRALLVLDNFEQLPAEAAQQLGELLARLPSLHVLVTSRRLLGLDGEREHRIQALALPTAGMSLAEAASNPAVALFIDRARAARDSFRLSERNAEAVCRLVTALEGVPLAIELAAARVRTHPLPVMLDMLRPPQGPLPGTEGRPGEADRGSTPLLDLLSRGGPAGPGQKRHDSLRKVIDWSWQQLLPAQASLLAELSLFPQGCRIEAAAALSGLPLEVARGRLDELQAQSLLTLEENEQGELRVSLSAAVREYAATRLDPSRAPVLRAGLRRWLRAWGEAQPPTPSLAQFRQELPNLQVALAGAAVDGAGEEAVQIVLALRAGFSAVSVPKQVVDAFDAALQACADPALRCRGRVMLVVLRYELGEHQAARQLAALALTEAPAGDGALRARALHRHAYVEWLSTRDNARLGQALDEALALARSHGLPDTEAGVLAMQAMIAGSIDRDHPRQEALHRQVLALYQRIGNLHLVNAGLYNLAICAFNRRAYAEALQRLDAVSEACARLDDPEFLARAAHVRGNTFAALRQWPQAAQAHREAIAVAYANASLTPLSEGLMDLPQALAHLGQAAAAMRLAAFAHRHRQQHLGEPGSAEKHKLRRNRRLAATQLGAAELEAHEVQGACMSLPEAVRLALGEGGG